MTDAMTTVDGAAAVSVEVVVPAVSVVSVPLSMCAWASCCWLRVWYWWRRLVSRLESLKMWCVSIRIMAIAAEWMLGCDYSLSPLVCLRCLRWFAGQCLQLVRLVLVWVAGGCDSGGRDKRHSPVERDDCETEHRGGRRRQDEDVRNT